MSFRHAQSVSSKGWINGTVTRERVLGNFYAALPRRRHQPAAANSISMKVAGRTHDNRMRIHPWSNRCPLIYFTLLGYNLDIVLNVQKSKSSHGIANSLLLWQRGHGA